MIGSLPNVASPARACINEYLRIYVLPLEVRQVEAVERAMAAGDSRAALRRLPRAHVEGPVRGRPGWADSWGVRVIGRLPPHLSAADLGDGVSFEEHAEGVDFEELPEADVADVSALEARKALLRAILLVRVDGSVTRDGRPARRVLPRVREENLAGAMRALDELVASAADDPRAAAYRAEAIARLDPGRTEEALGTLRDLARRDLLGDPLSWVALARLEGEAGAREAAMERCRALSRRSARRACRL